MVSIEVIAILIISLVFLSSGLFLTISGIIKLKTNKRKHYKRILIGICLIVSLPLLGKLSAHFQVRNYETDIIGNYSKLDQKETALKIFTNKTFEIYKDENILIKKGKWIVSLNDIPTLVLNPHIDGTGYSTNEPMYEISTSEKTVKLIPIFGDKDSGTLKMK